MAAIGQAAVAYPWGRGHSGGW